MADPIVTDPDDPTTSIADQIRSAAAVWAHSQHELVVLAAAHAESPEWILAGFPTAAAHVAALAEVETCTAREWIRVGKRVRRLPTIGRLFSDRALSYSKVRALVSVATPDNEEELAALALQTPASDLRRSLAAWLNDNSDPEDLAAYHHRHRSVRWRTEADGMVTVSARLEPAVAARLTSALGTVVARRRPPQEPTGEPPTLAQQFADALDILVDGPGVETEVVLHVRGDGCTTDDGTPIPDTVMGDLVDDAFIRAMVHDAEGRPINASARRRHPSRRQKRVVKERDRRCVDCGSTDLLQFDHDPDFSASNQTVVDELKLRCAPCHRRRHDDGGANGSGDR